MAAIISTDGRWQAAKDAGRLVQVSELENGDRFVDAIGGECTYEFADGAGLGATHHARREDGSERLIAGWLKVAKL